jgi:hypothetical protein
MFRQVSVFVLEILPWGLAALIGLFLVAGHAASPGRADLKPAPAVPVMLASANGPSR